MRLTLSLLRMINFKFPLQPHLTRNITSHSMKNLAFHSLPRLKMFTSLIHYSLKGWENVLFELGSERVKEWAFSEWGTCDQFGVKRVAARLLIVPVEGMNAHVTNSLPSNACSSSIPTLREFRSGPACEGRLSAEPRRKTECQKSLNSSLG